MTWDWTQVSQTIGKHTTHQTNELVTYFHVIMKWKPP